MPGAIESPPNSARKGVVQWLHEIRSSSRLGYLLVLVSRALNSLMGLLWTRLLLGAMGKPLNGVFLTFQSAAQLGGLGDLGMGAAIGIQTGQLMGQEKHSELLKFLAAARTVFLLLALTVGGGFLLLSPWLPGWLRFPGIPEAGSNQTLFLVGAASVGTLILYSYVSNLNYACKTVTWPVLPAFVVLQCSLAVHWLLARQHTPLWVQYLPYVGASLINLLLAWVYLRLSFRDLSRLLPLKLDFKLAVSLIEKSFWLYLASLGNVIYLATDRLVIQGRFGPEQVPLYHYNYRICELFFFVILSASFVILPKITQWLAAPGPEARQRVVASVRRLNQFQTIFGCGAAMGYLTINDFFMTHWLGPAMLAPLLWQAAFALNLVVTTSGDAGIQVAFRCGDHGIRLTGGLIGLTGLLNLGLSILSAKMGYIPGIAMATVAAQSILSLVLGFYVCRHLGMAWLPWLLRSWVLPVLAVSAAAALRMHLPFDSAGHILVLIGCDAAILLVIAFSLGINASVIREEMGMLRSFLPKK